MGLIKAHGLTKEYRSGEDIVKALDDVHFKVKAEEFLALMGPSGSGKSTLLSILGGLNVPTDGRLEIDEIDVYDLTLERLADFRSEYMGFVFQSFQLIPYLTAVENVMLPLSITRISSSDQKKKAIETLKRVGLAGKENRLPNQLSGGEQERVAIARAVVNDPPIILADEPTGNLDSKTGEGIMQLFKELNEEGQTIMMVTHDPNLAKRAERILKISDGRINNSVE